MRQALNKPLKTFSLTGGFSVGKTFITNILAGTWLQSGETVHTSGISLYLRDGIVFMDTAGSGNPVNHTRLHILDRRLTDYFIEKVVSDTSHAHIFVINRMNNLIQEKLMIMQEKSDDTIVLIHNLRNIKTMKDAELAIKRDIIEVFPTAVPDECFITKAKYYKSNGIVHFIFAE
jgi:hypothetical protein